MFTLIVLAPFVFFGFLLVLMGLRGAIYLVIAFGIISVCAVSLNNWTGGMGNIQIAPGYTKDLASRAVISTDSKRR